MVNIGLKHPTVSDAFARYVSRTPELLEIYLRGATATSITDEVVCAGCDVYGAPVTVPDSLHSLLADKLSTLESQQISGFLFYRANATFCKLMLKRRPDVLKRLNSYYFPMTNDTDADLAVKLFEEGLLPEAIRKRFVNAQRTPLLISRMRVSYMIQRWELY